ncbi:MAG: hypothetical protein ACR2P7_03470, partial [bacterium]
SGEIADLSSANLSLTERLSAATAQFEDVAASLRAAQQRRRELDAQLAAQLEALRARDESLAQLAAQQQESAGRQAASSAEIARLSDAIRQRRAENAALQELADAAGDRFRSLQQEYESLDAKYRNLARPARSPAGKYVVEVRIVAADGGYRFRLREPSGGAITYDKVELMLQLDKLKQAHGLSLYTKVVIPQDSDLTHNRAWRLTEEILRGYDYYYQQR